MSKQIAIDVGSTSVRYLLADVGRGKVRVLHFGRVDLDDSTPGPDRLELLADRLRDELANVGGMRARAIVAVHRGDVDIRRFTFPPATDDELVDLITVQVESEAEALGDSVVVDFVPVPADPETDRRALAIVATEKRLQDYSAFCESAGVNLRRVVLRPYAAASLRNHSLESAVWVNVLGNEIDLAVVSGDQVLFWRTVQLTSEEGKPASVDQVGAEIARTLAAVETDFPKRDAHKTDTTAGDLIDQIILLGNSEEYARWASSLEEQTGLAVNIVDLTKADGVSQGDFVSEPGLASPLLAMLLGEANGQAPAIDLLNPRKAPKSKSTKRTAVLAAIMLIAALFVGGDLVARSHEETDEAVKKLRSELVDLRAEGKQLKSQLALAQSIAAWENSGVVWLDELRDLALKFPTSQDVVVRAMTISSLRNNGAMIRVTGQVRDPAVVVQMDHDLRDAYRNATSTNF